MPCSKDLSDSSKDSSPASSLATMPSNASMDASKLNVFLLLMVSWCLQVKSKVCYKHITMLEEDNAALDANLHFSPGELKNNS